LELTCKELVELVTDYLEEKLPLDDVVRFERHISTCEGCTNYLEQIRQTIGVLGHIHGDALTSKQWDDLLEIFRDWKNG